jgi:mannose-6-phosphate isomerase-like protein (cupin superfamily)
VVNAERLPINVRGWAAKLKKELDYRPGLWDRCPLRTFVGSPFEGTSDIWLRYRDPKEIKVKSDWGEPHKPVWYPEANLLPEVKMICDRILKYFEPAELGGVLITRIPPQSEVKWHSDEFAWHARYYNRKVYTILEGNKDCVNYFEDEMYRMLTGECWLFNNLVQHKVENHSNAPRISLITCVRYETGCDTEPRAVGATAGGDGVGGS